MYDPTIGRWTSEDPIGFRAGDPNLYRYVNNRPTYETDPSGLVPPTNAELGLPDNTQLPSRDAADWTGAIGNSTFRPRTPAAFGLHAGEEIPFANGRPNFEAFAVRITTSSGTTIQIFPVPNLGVGASAQHSPDRTAMLRELARLRGETVIQTAAWLRQNGYVLHHAGGNQTQVVPYRINGGIPHTGGRSDNARVVGLRPNANNLRANSSNNNAMNNTGLSIAGSMVIAGMQRMSADTYYLFVVMRSLPPHILRSLVASWDSLPDQARLAIIRHLDQNRNNPSGERINSLIYADWREGPGTIPFPGHEDAGPPGSNTPVAFWFDTLSTPQRVALKNHLPDTTLEDRQRYAAMIRSGRFPGELVLPPDWEIGDDGVIIRPPGLQLPRRCGG